jgi:hypothetical protein
MQYLLCKCKALSSNSSFTKKDRKEGRDERRGGGREKGREGRKEEGRGKERRNEKKKKEKAKVSTLTTSIQHCIGILASATGQEEEKWNT